jgi:threonine synthase
MRLASERWGRAIDTHTADGLKVALERREAGVPMIVLETALPAKFSETVVEALGREPVRPAGMENLESLPQRFEVMDADVAAMKDYIARHAG